MPFFPHPRRRVCKRLAAAATLFLCSFFAGNVLAHTISSFSSLSTDFLPVSASCENWGLSFQQEGKPPVANATSDYLKQFQTHYIADTTESVLYLTFDAGYENGNTEAILDALKKHHAPATFFLVGNYLETSPDLVKRMMAEGHTIGNHTWHHPDMSKIADQSSFSEELSRLEQKYQEIIPSFSRTAIADHEKILPAAPGKIQRIEFKNGKRDGLPYLFLEPRLCGLVRKQTADP